MAEKDAGSKELLKDDRNEYRIGKEDGGAFAYAFGRTVFRFQILSAGKGFLKRKDRESKEHEAGREHKPEDPSPACKIRNERAEERCSYGRNALDGSHDAHEAPELSPRIAVCGNGARHHNGAGGAEPFQKAHDKKDFNRRRRCGKSR